jgi:hypothetical protein
MRTIEQNLDNLTPRRGLHRVWKSICEGDRAQLVARWIDAETEKNQPYENCDAVNGDEAARRGFVSVCTSPNGRRCLHKLRTFTVSTAA